MTVELQRRSTMEEHNLTSETCCSTPVLMCDNCIGAKDTEQNASTSGIEDIDQSQASASDSVHPEDGVAEFLKTMQFLIKPSQRKRHKFGDEAKAKSGSYRTYVLEEWPGTPVTCCGKKFESSWSFKYHIEKRHIKSRRYRLG
ncbi:hypothetical protein AC249_AIPGENE6479 [Exaiptasia diaphana]|nr:hypothetical protein AC249_AIPGENE6479 [Exaiptasia diaphana]